MTSHPSNPSTPRHLWPLSGRWLVTAGAVVVLLAGGAGLGCVALAAESVHAEMAYDFQLVNQEGQAVRLSDFRGKAVLLSFIFTRCPMPNMCPLVTTKMVFARFISTG